MQRRHRKLQRSQAKKRSYYCADALHASNSVDELFDLLKDADTKDDEIAVALARAYHDKAEDSEEAANGQALKERLLRDGLAIAEGLKDGWRGGGYALKWYAILLGRLGDFLPTKEKVGNSYIRSRSRWRVRLSCCRRTRVFVTALGQWCYKVQHLLDRAGCCFCAVWLAARVEL